MKLTILPDGTVEGIYTDDAAGIFAALGRPDVIRASHVEPVSTESGVAWAVYTRTGKDTGQRFATRAEALAWEVSNIELCLERNAS